MCHIGCRGDCANGAVCKADTDHVLWSGASWGVPMSASWARNSLSLNGNLLSIFYFEEDLNELKG